MLGHRPPRLLKPVEQRLKAKDPRTKQRYCKKVEDGYKKAQIQNRVDNLEEEVKQFLESGIGEQEIINKYNAIQKEIYEIRKTSSAKVRKVARGAVPWSPKLQKLRDCIDLWKRVVTLRTGEATSKTMLKRLARKLELQDLVHKSTLNQAIEKLKEAHKNYHAISKEVGSTRLKELKAMRRTEQQRRKGRAARRLRGKPGKTAVVKVTFRDAMGNERVADDHETLVKACAESNRRRQMQCQDTPFMTPPLLDKLGYLADTPAADEILKGTYEPPPGLDQYTRELLRELEMPEKIRAAGPMSVEVSAEEQLLAWKKQKENVAAEPSGLAFSHYKAVSNHNALVRVDAVMRGIPLQMGFAPDAWCHITDVEILKKANVLRCGPNAANPIDECGV